jgi:two-component system cell cycle sensor histidine kinase/response regulator CckA
LRRTLDDSPTTASAPAAAPARGGELVRALVVAADISRDGVLITDARTDGDGPRTVYVNRAFRELTGHSESELTGRSPAALFSARTPRAALADLARAIAAGGTFEGEVACVRRDGSVYAAALRVAPVLDDSGGVSHFVSSHRPLAHAPQADRAAPSATPRGWLAALFEPHADGILTLDGHGVSTGANAACVELTGRSPHELRGIPLSRLAADDDRARVDAFVRSSLAGQPECWTMQLAAPREAAWVTIATLPIVVDGAVTGLLAIVRDDTEKLRTEEALRRSEDQLRQAQKMESMGRLAGGIAHDFNNLLTAIAAYADFLLDEIPVTDSRRDDVREIRDAVDRAAALTRQLLAFSRRQRTAPHVLELGTVVGGMENLLRRVIGEHIELVTVLRPPMGRVLADAGQIEQIVMNLAVNARDAMPDGGALVIETANVDVAADATARSREATELARMVRDGLLDAGPYVMLAVSDTGVGMDEATRARIFEPFFTTKAPGQGTGLGLSTVRGIVDQSGAQLTVFSAPGGGAVFKIYFPRVDAPAQLVDAPAPDESVGGGEVVLVVEDDAVIRRLVRRTLERRGYTVLDAPDGAAALELSARHDGRIDLLLADVVMPELGGAELAAEMRPFRPGTRVLFMTGYAEDAPTRRGLPAGNAEVLEKPFSPASLARRVRDALDTRETRDAERTPA